MRRPFPDDFAARGVQDQLKSHDAKGQNGRPEGGRSVDALAHHVRLDRLETKSRQPPVDGAIEVIGLCGLRSGDRPCLPWSRGASIQSDKTETEVGLCPGASPW